MYSRVRNLLDSVVAICQENKSLLWSWMEFHVMGLILKVLVWSLNQQYFVTLSLSVAEISVKEEALVAPFLCNESRVVLSDWDFAQLFDPRGQNKIGPT